MTLASNEPPHFIRKATPGDRARWVELYESVAAELEWIGGEPPFPEGRVAAEFDRRSTYSPTLLSSPTLPSSPPADARALFVTELRHPTSHPIASATGLVGWIDLHEMHEPQRQLYVGMGVRSDHRGKGIGRDLLNTGIEFATTIGTHTLCLDVLSHNERAIGLYRSLGFVGTEQTRSINRKDGRTFQGIEMICRLKP
jgi:GNAT superfamily N-acetyltransferase